MPSQAYHVKARTWKQLYIDSSRRDPLDMVRVEAAGNNICFRNVLCQAPPMAGNWRPG